MDLCIAAYPSESAFLNDAQKLRLQRDIHGIDLVQQQGAAVNLLKKPVSLLRAGVGALLRAKQHGLQQGVRNGGAVDRNKRAGSAGTGIVDALGKQLFSCAGFPVDHHIGV